MYRKTILFFIFLIFCSVLSAQNKRVTDSLEHALETAKDTAKVKILLALTWEFRNADFNSAIAYGNEARAISEKRGYTNELAEAYNFLGVVYRNIGNYPRSMQMFLDAREVSEKTGNLTDYAYAENNIGDVMRLQGNLLDAEKHVKKAEEKFRSLNDSVGLAYALLRLAEIYHDRKQYDEAQKAAFECMNIRKRQKNLRGLQSAYKRIGKTYHAQKNLQLAYEYLHASLFLSRNGGEKRGIVQTQTDIGYVHLTQGNLDSAEVYAKEAVSIAETTGAKHLIQDAYELAAKVAAEKKQYEKAYFYQAKFSEIYREILGESTQRAIESMQFTYDLEKKQTELDLLSKEQEIGKTIQIATGTVLLLLVLFVLFLFKNIKERSTTNKALIEKNNEISIIAENLSLANHEITEQKFLLDRKNQAITDSLNYAKRIQTTILPSKSYLKKFLPEMFVFFRPKDIVSGDFYWFHENISEGGNKIVLVAADCTGHGVPGAFMSLIGATLLNKIVKDGAVFSPAEILTKLDEAIQKDLRQKDTGNVDGMDAAIVVIDTSEKTLTFSGAKSPLLYIQNGELHFVKGSKVSVGGDVAQHRYEELEIDLRSETVFYIYSDGFQDQFGGYTGKKFMSKHFRELLFDIHKEAPDVQLEHLKKTLFEFQGHEPQVDDILVIGCKIKL